MGDMLVALDQGTSSTRAVVYGAADLAPLFTEQREFTQHYPRDGWVEHDAEEIWSVTQEVLRAAGDYAQSSGGKVRALGITNQRETVVLWDRKTGEPLHRAIVWQDRRTADRCAELKRDGVADMVNSKTGLLLDPYFSATKLDWLLRHTDSAGRAAKGEVLAGTIDAFLVWRLTGGASFKTDVTNASRTQLFSLRDMDWDDELLALHGVPRACLPEVADCAADFGETGLLGGGKVPIGGIAGDQQAASLGQACLDEGDAKSTYGTGCFLLVQGGDEPVVPGQGLLGTVGYRVGGRTCYAAEGSIFVAGAAVQWLRDRLGLFADASETAGMAEAASGDGGTFLVPAFTGLGAPHWCPEARGTLVGMTLDTDRNELVRATLTSIACSTLDLVEAFASQGIRPRSLNVDGGMVANDWFVQHLADVTGIGVSRPSNIETTAAGAAFLAGLQSGVYSSLEDVSRLRAVDRDFEPVLGEAERERLLGGWRRAVETAVAHAGRVG